MSTFLLLGRRVVTSTGGWLTTARPCDSGAGIEPVGIASSSGPLSETPFTPTLDEVA